MIKQVVIAICFFSTAANTQTAELVVQTGHTSQIHSVAVSPDGLTVASGSSDRTVRLWDASTGRLLRSLVGHTARVFAVAFSPDSSLVASGGRSSEIKVWDRRTGTLVSSFTSGLNAVSCLRFSRDARKLAVGGLGNKIEMWNLEAKRKADGPAETMYDPVAVAFSRDGKMLAAVSGSGVIVWNADDLRLIKRIRTQSGGRVLAFRPDGKALAIEGSDGVDLIDVETERRLWSAEKNPGGFSSLVFDTDGGRLIAAARMGFGYVLDVATGARLVKFGDEDGTVDGAAFYPDGSRIVTASFGNLKYWDAATGELLREELENSSSVNGVAFAPVGLNFAFSSRISGLRVFDAESGAISVILPYQTTSWSVGFGPEAEMSELTLSALAFTRDGRRLASESSGVIGTWNVTDGSRGLSYGPQRPSTFSFLPNGRELVVGYDDGAVRVFPVSGTRRERTLKPFDGRIRAISLGAGGRIAAISDGTKIKIFDGALRTARRTIAAPSTAVTPVAVHPAEYTLAVADNAGVHLLDLTSNKRSDLPVGAERVQTIAFDPGGGKLAAGIWNGDVILFDTRTAAVSARILAHSSNVTTLAFSADGVVLLSGGNDGSAKLWDTRSNQEICTVIAVDQDDWVVVAPDGRFDTNKDLDKIDGLHWVISDDPFSPKPLDLFMRQYYEPGLLPRLMKCTRDGNCDSEFKRLPSIAEINRVPPQVGKPKGPAPLQE